MICFLLHLISYGQYDLVIQNGRVIDPESGLDGIRNLGIIDDTIAIITTSEITGDRSIDATALVVAPGFIDPHIHGVSVEAQRYQIRDGVTTALELESGIGFIKYWLESKAGKSLLNYGASAAHSGLRHASLRQNRQYIPETQAQLEKEGYSSKIINQMLIRMMRSRDVILSEDDISHLKTLIEDELKAGAIGIGVPVGYYPQASHYEIFKSYEMAAQYGTTIFSHVRDAHMAAIQEAIANATITGARLHIVHLNSMSLSKIKTGLALVEAAQRQGFPITTEVYPYTAASTSLESVLFDEGWQAKWGMDYQDLQWQATGERLTAETFKKYRSEGGIIIMHMMKPAWIEEALASPITMIGSDGMPYAPLAHPRTAGTYARILGRYVREEGVLNLPEAIRKMTIMPAQMLEAIAPAMKRKGRLQVGADADITIFDPATVIDKASFEKGLDYSEGIIHVIVNGRLTVHDSEIVDGVFNGEPVYGHLRSR